jgi:hypothetical protein
MTKFSSFFMAAFLASVATASAHVEMQASQAQQQKQQQEQTLCEFAPKNDLRIPDTGKYAGGITREQYDRATTIIEKIYTPIVAAKGGVLKMNRMWTTDDVNSSANRKGNEWHINAYGGLARYKSMTYDGELMVLCHEMGHHMGGFPQYTGMFGGASWASNEGQSDYFATMKCFRRVIENDDNEAILAGMRIPAEVSRGCQIGFKSAKEIAICKRSAIAGRVVAQVLYELGRGSSSRGEPATPPAFETPSQAVVTATNHKHPLAQCRLDTYFAGAVCGVGYRSEFGVKEAKSGACSQEAGDAFGFRPRCWYKPAERF